MPVRVDDEVTAMTKACLALLAACSALSPAMAQAPRAMLEYSSAAAIRDGCLAWARERKLTVAVAVYDESGRMLAFAHMDGAATAVAEFAQWKGRSAATIHVASAETANWGKGPPGLATWEGGLPIFSTNGVALGGVGVSGAESSEDVACGRAGIAAAGLKEAA
ncbi:heme-binding protein [Croceibacterium sp. LX-88]|uniref:Heme-binding protein n=1 Tax=Croceibacterium selenioxidans TaxID=2838833 RepID=A0ABS5W821_9SPHN|nr:heme-binding protein [Croceibacterium selenioxidans]MBT2135923.1 heme-binding protein [Croceibacterium selenioxidans]